MLLLSNVGRKYALKEDYLYKDVLVPAGYLTDGISYKFRLFGALINRFDPRFIEAVVIHDYLTDNDEWEKANLYFEELLPKHYLKGIMVSSVNLYKTIKGK